MNVQRILPSVKVASFVTTHLDRLFVEVNMYICLAVYCVIILQWKLVEPATTTGCENLVVLEGFYREMTEKWQSRHFVASNEVAAVTRQLPY